MARSETRDTVADRIVDIGKQALHAQAAKIRRLTAERDAARAQLDQAGATIRRHVAANVAPERRVEGLARLNSHLNADLDEVCQELARAKEEVAVLREELADHRRWGSDHH